jgi:hypothetical protein
MPEEAIGRSLVLVDKRRANDVKAKKRTDAYLK